MDSTKIESEGIKPLQPWLDKVNTISDIKSLVSTVAELKKIGSSTLFSDFVTQDDKNSDVMTYKLRKFDQSTCAFIFPRSVIAILL